MIRKFSTKPNNLIPQCHNCKNNTQFVAHSERGGEDFYEIWVTCKCGFDPTENDTGNRLEDVWGDLTDDKIRVSIQIYSDLINEKLTTLH